MLSTLAPPCFKLLLAQTSRWTLTMESEAWAEPMPPRRPKRKKIAPSPGHERRLARIFRSPLIIGASLSANFASASPGLRAALRYTTADNIVTVARHGMPGRILIPRLGPQHWEGRSVVIGIDLFFWDSVWPWPGASLDALRQLIRTTREAGIPLLIGDVAGMFPMVQPSLLALNREIHALCAAQPHCHVFRFHAAHRAVTAARGLQYGGRHYALGDLTTDGLHLNDVASEYVADQIVELLAYHPKGS